MEADKKRLIEFDYAKTLAILFMVIIHVVEELSNVEVYETLPKGMLENIIQFGAGPLAAPQFMLAMGVGVVFSRYHDPRSLFRRGVRLLLLGLALNIGRDVIPRLLAAAVSGKGPDWENLYFQIFNIDILHFAGLAMMFTALLKALRVPVLALIPIGVILQAAGNWLALLTVPKGGAAEAVCSYFFYTGELSSFPLLNWYIIMAAGLVGGELLLTARKVNDSDRFFLACFIGGAGLLAGIVSTCLYYRIDIRNFYALYNDWLYKQTFFHFLFNACIIAVELSAFHFLCRHGSKCDGFASFCGVNLNTIYIIQWMIIGWLASFKDLLKLDLSLNMSVVVGIVIAFISIGITRLLPRIRLTGHRDPK